MISRNNVVGRQVAQSDSRVSQKYARLRVSSYHSASQNYNVFPVAIRSNSVGLPQCFVAGRIVKLSVTYLLLRV